MNPGMPKKPETSGILEDWGIDFMSEDYNKSICGEIYNSTLFDDGKLIYTSRINNFYIENNLSEELGIKPFIIVNTINDSKYILGTISNQFKDYINFLIDKNKLCSKTYSLNTNQGIIKCMNIYLKNNN